MKLWEVGTGRLVKQYLGATHMQLQCQVCKDGFLLDSFHVEHSFIISTAYKFAWHFEVPNRYCFLCNSLLGMEIKANFILC